ncbi:MAG: protein-L-isoaspartate(D-aspartate) O-methyltransferase [Proteobacteria bacterium]|nr:protein-L-isoaspartate(D-aspartate) O-methyltransferase [Pseudomonadota bacterium]MBU1650209.1 protein-L-isoaspartate(D-aspartate) O-methyltransferase [Pseudomonadota bacterium]
MSNRQQIDAMLHTIEIECSFTKGFTGRSSLLPEVMEAMRLVSRQDFVPPSLAAMAYENTPLPIGKGQTISQPFIVALMTDLLCPEKGDVVLEVGAGSGYQAAILSLLVRKVYTIEIIPALAERAMELLQRLGYGNVEVRQGDGYHGWPEYAPFDGIMVTAAATHVPPSLKEQLKPGGKMIIPVGSPYVVQELLVLEKDQQGIFTTRNVLPVSFVPLTRA